MLEYKAGTPEIRNNKNDQGIQHHRRRSCDFLHDFQVRTGCIRCKCHGNARLWRSGSGFPVPLIFLVSPGSHWTGAYLVHQTRRKIDSRFNCFSGNCYVMIVQRACGVWFPVAPVDRDSLHNCRRPVGCLTPKVLVGGNVTDEAIQ